MSLTGRFARAIWRRFERMTGVYGQIAYQKRAVELSIEAEKAACSSLDDSQAKALLAERLSVFAERLSADPGSMDAARTILSRRSEYMSNRAYRLLSAIAGDTHVAPVPQHLEQLFDQEEALGRMPLDRAFQCLAEMEPRLRDVEQQVHREIVDPEHRPELAQSVHKVLINLVGVSADQDFAILGTNLAASIVRQYLEILSGTTILGSVSTPYFDAPLRIGVRA